jgi:hypothetical protein
MGRSYYVKLKDLKPSEADYFTNLRATGMQLEVINLEL